MQRFVQSILAALSAVLVLGATPAPTHAQTINVIHVDIENGDLDPSNFGRNGWGSDAYRFLQDALDAAQTLLDDPEAPSDLEVHIWVAAGTYRPDQTKDNSSCGEGPQIGNCCPPYGHCNHSSAVFDLGSNIHLYGGFPPDADDEQKYGQGGATMEHRDPSEYETTLSGDLKGDDDVTVTYPNGYVELTFDNYTENSEKIIKLDQVQNVVIDGFTIRGNIDIHNAQVQFLDCVFDARQGAPLRCGGESDVIVWRGRLSEGARKLPARCVAVEGEARVFLAESRDAVSAIGCD